MAKGKEGELKESVVNNIIDIFKKNEGLFGKERDPREGAIRNLVDSLSIFVNSTEPFDNKQSEIWQQNQDAISGMQSIKGGGGVKLKMDLNKDMKALAAAWEPLFSIVTVNKLGKLWEEVIEQGELRHEVIEQREEVIEELKRLTEGIAISARGEFVNQQLDEVVYGFSPLHLAAINGDQEAKAKLFSKNPKTLIELLRDAARCGYFKTVELLLDTNISIINGDPEITDDGTPLWLALNHIRSSIELDDNVAKAPYIKTILLLIRRGAKVNTFGADREIIGFGADQDCSPLHLAVEIKEHRLVEEFLKLDVDMNSKEGRANCTPMQQAFDVDHPMVELFLKYDKDNKLDIFCRNSHYNTGFALAKKCGNHKILQGFEDKFKATIVATLAKFVKDSFQHSNVDSDSDSDDTPTKFGDEIFAALAYLKDSKILTDCITENYQVDQTQAKNMINFLLESCENKMQNDLSSSLTPNLKDYLVALAGRPGENINLNMQKMSLEAQAKAVVGSTVPKASTPPPSSLPTSRPNSSERKGPSGGPTR